MSARRYMATSTAPPPRTSGASPWPTRKHAATNPKAWFYRQPITLEDHQNSRWIVEPLRLLDCCQESDGGVGRGGDEPRARPRSASSRRRVIAGRRPGREPSEQQMMTGYYRDDITGLPEMGLVARSSTRPRASAPRTSRPP